MIRRLMIVCVVAGLLGTTGTCFAGDGVPTDHHWTGALSNDWLDPFNWLEGTVPDSDDRAFCEPPLAAPPLNLPTLLPGTSGVCTKIMSTVPPASGQPEAEAHIYGEMQITQAIFWPDSGGCYPTLYTHAGGEIHQGQDLELGWGDDSGGTYIMEAGTKSLPAALHTAQDIQVPGRALWGHLTMESGTILHQYAYSYPDRLNAFEIGESIGAGFPFDPLDSYIEMAPGAALRIAGADPDVLAYRIAQVEGYIGDGRLRPVSSKGGLYVEYEVIETGPTLPYEDKWWNGKTQAFDVYPYIEVRVVPEPATLSLLGSLLVLGGVTFLCRRRS